MTVDMNTPIPRGDGTVGMVFKTMREGSIEGGNPVVLEFTGKVQRTEKDPNKVMLELSDADDPDAKSSVFCNMADQAGLVKMVDLIACSLVEKKIQRVRPEFKVEGLTGTILNNDAFHEQLKNSLPGCRIYGTVKHTKGKDKDGKEQTYANIMTVAEIKAGGPTAIDLPVAGMPGTALASAQATPATKGKW